MKNFARLYKSIDQANKSEDHILAFVDFFKEADDKDKLWAIALFSHYRPKKSVSTSFLEELHLIESEYPIWLFEECRRKVGDTIETISLIMPNPSILSHFSLSDWVEIILELYHQDESIKKENILSAWKSLDQDERLLLNKLLTGGFRLNVPLKVIIQAVSRFTRIDENKVTHRLSTTWDPLKTTYEELILRPDSHEDLSKPYVFGVLQTIVSTVRKLGSPSEWSAERLYEGIRAQMILRGGELFIWSFNSELITNKFPEFDSVKKNKERELVLDGEILPFKDGQFLEKNRLISRFKRKNLSKKQVLDVPVIFVAYDLLEYAGKDIRNLHFTERRKLLEEVVIALRSDQIIISESLSFTTWEQLDIERSKSRTFLSEGIFLKRNVSVYNSGETNNDWWKWKPNPMSINAVLLYAQRGRGREGGVHSEYTFAVRSGDSFVPFVKAYEGLTEEEYAEIALFVKKNTVERFGPVYSIKPELVFEITFEAIEKSSRHKSGVILSAPTIKMWKKKITVEEVNTMSDLMEKLKMYQGEM